METLTIINYTLLVLATTWTFFMLVNTQADCRKNCDVDAAKNGFATYLFGLTLIFILYFALSWAMLG
ncbi:MAG: hypothetical protein HOL87_01800 [Candidatus Thioglobus sp.]|nr:hypothetical protein [Candidatus Thioglobus sp.]